MKGQFRLFSKERLKSGKTIGGLFQSGQTLSYPPIFIKFRIFKTDRDQQSELKVAFGVSKKHFKRAVDRNRVKRLMREAYRLNAASLRNRVDQGRSSLHFIMTYTDQNLPSFEMVNGQVTAALKRLEGKLVKKAGRSN